MQHSMTILNQIGLLFRQDLNNALQALTTQFSGAIEPEVTFPHMPWVDTSGASPILKYRNAENLEWITIGPIDRPSFGLNVFANSPDEPSDPEAFQPWIEITEDYPVLKIRNADNNAWVTLGRVDLADLGHLPKTGGEVSGPVTSTDTSHWKIPVGSTEERPEESANGFIRYNTSLKTYEGYRETGWGPLGGGQVKPHTAQTALAAGGTIAINNLDTRQMIQVASNVEGGSILSDTPFGNIAALEGPYEVILYSATADRPVIIKFNDIDNGCIGNGDEIDIRPGFPVKCLLIPSSKRILVERGI